MLTQQDSNLEIEMIEVKQKYLQTQKIVKILVLVLYFRKCNKVKANKSAKKSSEISNILDTGEGFDQNPRKPQKFFTLVQSNIFKHRVLQM